MPGAEGFRQTGFDGRRGRRSIAVSALFARTAQYLPNGVQLNSVSRTGVADPIMEPETEPGGPGQRSIHSLRSQPGDFFAGESDMSQ